MAEKINPIMNMDYIKLLTKKEKELETDRNSKNIEPEYRNQIWH